MPNEGMEKTERSWILKCLFSVPIYKQLWTENRGELYEESLQQVRNTSNPLQQLIRCCIVFKKHCQLSKARLLFLEMVIHHPDLTQYWIEFTRMEMETGCYANAHLVVDLGLQLAPNNIFLIIKKLKIADKQRDVASVESTIDSLFASDRQKAIRVLAEAVSSLTRLGHFDRAMMYIQEAMKFPIFFTGCSLCELLVFSLSSYSVAEQIDLLNHIAALALKYIPLWSLCLDLQEHILFLRCPLQKIYTLPANPQYDALCNRAFSALSNDSAWKVFQIRILKSARLLTLLRVVDPTMWNAPDPTQSSHAVAEETAFLVASARSAVITCPGSMRWKVFLMLGRAAAMMGQPAHARAVEVE